MRPFAPCKSIRKPTADGQCPKLHPLLCIEAVYMVAAFNSCFHACLSLYSDDTGVLVQKYNIRWRPSTQIPPTVKQNSVDNSEVTQTIRRSHNLQTHQRCIVFPTAHHIAHQSESPALNGLDKQPCLPMVHPGRKVLISVQSLPLCTNLQKIIPRANSLASISVPLQIALQGSTSSHQSAQGTCKMHWCVVIGSPGAIP